MTEAEWRVYESPEAMLTLMKKASDRKHRLFQVACLRRVWHLMPNEDWRAAVALVERYADKKASDRARIATCHKLHSIPYPNAAIRDAVSSALEATCKTMRRNRQHSIGTHGVFAYTEVPEDEVASKREQFQAVLRREREVEAHLVRDIFPFRKVKFNKAWRTDTAVLLAAQRYESRDFSAMPILADALQDAGCDSTVILDHCRGAGPHVRGCWVVDLVLGKE